MSRLRQAERLTAVTGDFKGCFFFLFKLCVCVSGGGWIGGAGAVWWVFAWHSLSRRDWSGRTPTINQWITVSDGRTSHCCLAAGQKSVALCGGQLQLSGTLYSIELLWLSGDTVHSLVWSLLPSYGVLLVNQAVWVAHWIFFPWSFHSSLALCR